MWLYMMNDRRRISQFELQVVCRAEIPWRAIGLTRNMPQVRYESPVWENYKGWGE